MAAARKSRPAVRHGNGVPKDSVQALVAEALGREDDVIITSETDSATLRKTIHVMTGRLVGTCMLNRLLTRIRTFPEDGDRVVSLESPPGKP